MEVCMGKIDWYCRECDYAFRAYVGKCSYCNKHIRPVDYSKLEKESEQQLSFLDDNINTHI